MRGLALLLLSILLAGCASDGPAKEEVVFPDVHGVAVDPLDTSFVYVATHRGLFRGNADGWERVGETQHDLMGFTLAADGRTAYASGHPRDGGNLGLLRSTDGGATWLPLGAAGADFHALAVSPADSTRVYGHYRGTFMRSTDGGARWTEHARMNVASLAAHPRSVDVLYAATTSAVAHSQDAGSSWVALAAVPALGVAVDDALYASGAGFVARSEDGGATWEDITPEPETTFGHVGTRGDVVVTASYQGGVWRSEDAGGNWTRIHEPSR